MHYYDDPTTSCPLYGDLFRAYTPFHTHRHALEGYLWHADHIKPVFQGGGMCTIENLRTLCVPCHADVTKKQAAQRAAARQYASGQRLLTEFLSPRVDAKNSEAAGPPHLGKGEIGKGALRRGKGTKGDKVTKRSAPESQFEEAAEPQPQRRRYQPPVLQMLKLTPSPSPTAPCSK